MNIALRKIAHRTKLWNEWALEQEKTPLGKLKKFDFLICPSNYYKHAINNSNSHQYWTYTEFKSNWVNKTPFRFEFAYVLLPYSEEVKAKKWTCEKIWDENYVKSTKENS